MATTDGQLGLVAFRAQSTLADLRLRLPAALARQVCRLAGGFSIGDEVLLSPGVLVPHGQVVIDGRTTVGAGSSIRPWCRLSPLPGTDDGPTLGGRVMVGTGAHVIGPVKVGTWAVIGAHAVVTEDVPPRATVVGNPARVVAIAPPKGRRGPQAGASR
ncbi:MAG: hypothetical protein JJU45_03085 [Acidimicrobiia bacterium]|nr:hypothetical protein [Acidimicrobiia bacterium]